MRQQSFRKVVLCFAVLSVAIGSACRRADSREPSVATPSVSLSHDRAPAGSPLEIAYKFVVANDAKIAGDYRVMVHVVDTDEELMWTDDHNPPIPTSQWQPGQTVEYRRTVFVPIFPYVGTASLHMGLYSTTDQRRLPLVGQDMGQRAYKVGQLELLPQTENLFTVFKDGWHPMETAEYNAMVEWQWTKKAATLAFRNPKKDALFYLELDSPGRDLHGPQLVQINLGGQTIDEFTLTPTEQQLRKVKLSAAELGAAEMAELQIVVDKTFVPAVINPAATNDPRDLGVRVFHAFVDPR